METVDYLNEEQLKRLKKEGYKFLFITSGGTGSLLCASKEKPTRLKQSRVWDTISGMYNIILTVNDDRPYLDTLYELPTPQEPESKWEDLDIRAIPQDFLVNFKIEVMAFVNGDWRGYRKNISDRIDILKEARHTNFKYRYNNELPDKESLRVTENLIEYSELYPGQFYYKDRLVEIIKESKE